MTNHRFYLFMLLLFIGSTAAPAQVSLTGKWYMLVSNQVMELRFAKDSILSRNLNWDMSAESSPGIHDTVLLTGSIESNGNIYMYAPKKDEPAVLQLNTLRITQPGKQLVFMLTNADKEFHDTAEIQEYIKTDAPTAIGLPVYSEAEATRLKQQKPIGQMTVTDFKAFADKLIQLKKETTHSTESPGILVAYGYAMQHDIVGRSGFNPFYAAGEYEALLTKFSNNPQTKELVKRLKNEEQLSD